MTLVRGYSREGRKVSAAVFLSLSVLFSVMSAIYGEKTDLIWSISLGIFSLVLFTPLWRVFYPMMFLAFGTSILWTGITHRSWNLGLMGVLTIVMAINVAIEIARRN